MIITFQLQLLDCRGRTSEGVDMSAGFYRSTTRNSSTPVSGARNGSFQCEKKLDQILDSIRDQSKQMTLLEEKGKQTLESVEGLDKRLALMENKVNNMEQLVSQEANHAMKQKTRVPPELSVNYL